MITLVVQETQKLVTEIGQQSNGTVKTTARMISIWWSMNKNETKTSSLLSLLPILVLKWIFYKDVCSQCRITHIGVSKATVCCTLYMYHWPFFQEFYMPLTIICIITILIVNYSQINVMCLQVNFPLPCRSLSPSHLVRELSLSYW